MARYVYDSDDIERAIKEERSKWLPLWEAVQGMVAAGWLNYNTQDKPEVDKIRRKVRTAILELKKQDKDLK